MNVLRKTKKAPFTDGTCFFQDEMQCLWMAAVSQGAIPFVEFFELDCAPLLDVLISVELFYLYNAQGAFIIQNECARGAEAGAWVKKKQVLRVEHLF